MNNKIENVIDGFIYNLNENAEETKRIYNLFFTILDFDKDIFIKNKEKKNNLKEIIEISQSQIKIFNKIIAGMDNFIKDVNESEAKIDINESNKKISGGNRKSNRKQNKKSQRKSNKRQNRK